MREPRESKQDDYKKLGKKIKLLRLQNKLRQKHVAEFMGVTRSTISEIERGKRALDVFEYIDLMRLFNPNYKSHFINEFRSKD